MYNIFCKKANQTLSIEFDKFPEHVKTHIIEYGLKQKYNDCLASETEESICKGLLDNLHQRLLQGELAKRVGTGNPVETRLKLLLRKIFNAKIGGKTADINKLSLDDLVTQLASKLAKPADAIRNHFTKIAEAQLEKERADEAKLTSGLDDLV